MLRYYDFINWKFLCYLAWVPTFKSINSRSLEVETYDGGNFAPTPRKRLRGQNTSVGIWLIELTEPSETLDYKTFSNIIFYRRFYTSFYCLYLWGTKYFVRKTWLYFIFSWFSWGGIRCYSIKGSMFMALLL